MISFSDHPLQTAVVPLFKNYMQFFLATFLSWVMLLHLQATSMDNGDVQGIK